MKPHRTSLVGALACAVSLSLAAPGPATAASQIDGIEHIFGATNVNAVTGHGRLSVGVSADGDVSVLTWPSPSYADQLGYLSSNAIDARSQARFGAAEGAGLFAGLLLHTSDGNEVTWLRDRETWQIEQSYGAGDGPNPVTVHSSARLGLRLTVTDAVDPRIDQRDLLVRTIDVEREPGSPVDAAWLLTYANLSPMPPSARIPELPVVDWLFDGSNDFAAIWDEAAHAIVHFHPDDQLIYDDPLDAAVPPEVAYGPIGDALQSESSSPEEVAALAGRLDQDYAAGSYLALSTVPAPDQHQIGFDATPFCAERDEFADNLKALPERFPGTALPIDASLIDLLRCRDQAPLPERQGWVQAPADAWADVSDGDLSGDAIAAGEVNEALRTPLIFTAAASGSRARAAVLLGAGATAAAARGALVGVDAAEVVTAAENDLTAWLAGLRLPAEGPPAVRTVARRSLINLRVGTDAASGAIVASIARQPPYGLDWMRDGAFFNVALDISGQSDLVDRRADLYIGWQRREPVAPAPLIDLAPPTDPRTGEAKTYPADAWEMNYYPDGRIGGIFRFEIDNTAFALWSIVSHAGWVRSVPPRRYLLDRWSPVAAAAELLAEWRDPATGLQAPAQEDDNGDYTQGLHGAVTVYGALDAAARAARYTGHARQAQAWESRACELRNAMLSQLYDGESMRFVARPGQRAEPDRGPTGQTAWLIWPMRVLPWDDARVDAQIAADLDLIQPQVDLQTEGGSYFMKSTVSFGLARGRDPLLADRIAGLRDQLALHHPTPDTHHFGESMLVLDGPDGPVASQRVADPHLWEGVLFYLTAMAVEAPDAFERPEEVLPPSRVPVPGSDCTAAPLCTGDCDGDFAVAVDELVSGVGASLDAIPIAECESFDDDGDGNVGVTELVRAVRNALAGCPS